MSKEEIKIITLGDIFKNIETEEKAFKFKDYIINLQQENKQLKEELEVSKTNEETYCLEMQEITKILGLDEHTLFDDVKQYVKNQISILTELEEWLKEQGNNGIDEWGNHYTVCLYKLNELKEKYK